LWVDALLLDIYDGSKKFKTSKLELQLYHRRSSVSLFTTGPSFQRKHLVDPKTIMISSSLQIFGLSGVLQSMTLVFFL
jgi:hypothetical protein